MLSNIYMIDFDKLMSHYVKSKNGTYMRYSDDLIIILPLTQKEDITNYKKKSLIISQQWETISHSHKKNPCILI